MMASTKLITELKCKRIEIVLRIKNLNEYIKNLDAVIEMFTLLSPKEIALNAINKDTDEIWTAKKVASELRNAHENRKLDAKGLEGKTFVQIGRSVLGNLLRQHILERVGRGQYKKMEPLMVSVSAIENLQDKHEKWRQKQESRGLCIKCSRPATSKTLCDYHRQKKRESYLQQKGE